MEKTKVSTVPHSFIQPHFDIVAPLTLLLDRSALTNDVKKHCNTALKVVGIIYIDAVYHTGTHLLSRKEFDDFFELFPEPFFNNRGLIPIEIIVQNIKKCIETDKILRFNS